LNAKKIKIGVDVTFLIFSNRVTGIERVIVETNKNLFKILDSQLYELHPFITVPEFEFPADVHPYLLSDPVLAKPLIDFHECDILFFGSINLNIPFKELLDLKHDRNLKILTIVHDVLPLTNPEWVPDPVANTGRAINLSTKSSFHIYLQATFALSDQVILTSEHVKKEIGLLGWKVKPQINVIPLGAFDSQIPASASNSDTTNTLYISTIEARKGHVELLAAFDLLWQDEFDITLTLIGTKGWKVETLIETIENHPMKDKKLFWRQNLVDSQVDEFYASSDIAFIVSEGEGFGLALEEGLSKGLKVIARDIPVFRERNYPNLYFFSGAARELSEKIKEISALPTKPLKPNEIRTMESFANEVAQLIKLL
jgi:glycosyltransferase involved in cell wall biosynthesis